MRVRTIVMSMTLVAMSAFTVPSWSTKATEPDAERDAQTSRPNNSNTQNPNKPSPNGPAGPPANPSPNNPSPNVPNDPAGPPANSGTAFR
jgi:hypothetical protein